MIQQEQLAKSGNKSTHVTTQYKNHHHHPAAQDLVEGVPEAFQEVKLGGEVGGDARPP